MAHGVQHDGPGSFAGCLNLLYHFSAVSCSTQSLWPFHGRCVRKCNRYSSGELSKPISRPHIWHPTAGVFNGLCLCSMCESRGGWRSKVMEDSFLDCCRHLLLLCNSLCNSS